MCSRPCCLVLVLWAVAGCVPGCGGGDKPGYVEADASDASTETDVFQDSQPPDSTVWSDAGWDASPNPHVIDLSPTGPMDLFGYTNAGHIITWAEDRGDPLKYLDVYYYNLLDRSEHQVTDREKGQALPYVHGNEIMFDEWRFYDSQNQIYQIELYLYDITAATQTRLTNGPAMKSWPKFNHDYILYYSDEGCSSHTERNLSLMDRNTQEATVLAQCGDIPETHSISENFAAWSAFSYSPLTREIFVRDLHAGVTFTVESPEPSERYCPHTDDGHVVWMDYRDGRREIYMYTFSTGQRVCLTPDGWEQAWPNLRNGIVSWCDYRYSQEWGEYGRCDIYVYEIATGVGRRVTAESRTWMPRFVDSGWIAYAHWLQGMKVKIYAHDLVGDGILTTDGHVIP